MGFLESVRKVLKSEGGYVNNPLDRGKATNRGVTLATLNEYFKLKNLGEATEKNIRDLTEEEAINIYKEMYYDKYRVERIPEAIQFDYFDTLVNSGARNANKILQSSLRQKLKRDDFDIDGIIGSQTMNAVEEASLSPLHFRTERSGFMWNIVFDTDGRNIFNPPRTSQGAFIVGWIKRVFHLDDQARTSLDEYTDSELIKEIKSRLTDEQLSQLV